MGVYGEGDGIAVELVALQKAPKSWISVGSLDGSKGASSQLHRAEFDGCWLSFMENTYLEVIYIGLAIA